MPKEIHKSGANLDAWRDGLEVGTGETSPTAFSIPIRVFCLLKKFEQRSENDFSLASQRIVRKERISKTTTV